MHKKKPLNGSQENGKSVFSNGKWYYYDKDKYQYDRKKYQEKDVGSLQKSVECVCPKCGEDHTFFMHWSGAGKPRKFCQDCKLAVNKLYPGSMIGMEHGARTRMIKMMGSE